ncbi:nuclear cap-binding protein subunit 3 isoform X2 [Cephus cinctus]|uniref:Nuclear cap-binding protein subunit 3 n=1 Tax=Cephus cinctus TaxID=211228 RepID=A0AAJ7RQ70_CEPCN|nr:nuclear cap-binding protein subunit 3 isoform X2 [Cephus cinctus]
MQYIILHDTCSNFQMNQVEEPMDVDTPFTDVEKVEEPAESNVKLNDSNELKNEISTSPQDTRYENRGGTFTTGIDIFSKEEKLKMEERARRFGLTDKVKTSDNEDQDLYSSMGIVEENESTKNLRLNAIHMRGTEEMSTKDVFKYFEDYAPASIEWINDVSCNVVWLDTVSPARALLRLSKKIKGLGEKVQADKDLKCESSCFDNENNMANDDCVVEVISEGDSAIESDEKKDENSINIKDITCPLPPGLWRKGIDYPKSKGILLRFATRADKKRPNAEKMSEYYKKYGNPNFGGIKGILTESRKRMYKEIRQNKKRPKEESKNDNTNGKRTKNPWGALSQSWGVNDSTEDDFINKNPIKNTDYGGSIKERLGIKTQPKDVPVESEESDEESDSEHEEDWCKRSKVLRMRMHADDEEEKVQKRRSQLRSQMTSTLNAGGDLRSRLGRSRNTSQFRNAIQVVVTNTNVSNFNSLKDGDSEEEGEIVEERIETDEREEGEWEDEEQEEDVEVHEDEEDDDSELSEKEIQGPKGSVIKVVQRSKPRVASTVWARLNNVKSEANNVSQAQSIINFRRSTRGDLRETLKGGDLRSRLGNHTRGRSPLRIEVKNDKYTEDDSNTE